MVFTKGGFILKYVKIAEKTLLNNIYNLVKCAK